MQQCQELHSFKLNCSGCEVLKEVKSFALSSKLQTADVNFQGCTALERLPLEMQQCQELHSFKLNCSGCEVLKEVKSFALSSKLQTADVNFQGCTALERLPLEMQQCQELHSFKLNCSGCEVLKEVKSFVLPVQVEEVELSFASCKSLERFPEVGLGKCQHIRSLKVDCSGTNWASKDLESLVLPVQVEVVELSFASCKSLERFPEVGLGKCQHIRSLKVDCSGTNWTSKDLESLVLPEQVEEVELSFASCKSLERFPEVGLGNCKHIKSIKVDCSGTNWTSKDFAQPWSACRWRCSSARSCTASSSTVPGAKS
eukprot:TRINITY_DN8070_c0_g1_i9.p2 TRINITY_DN8070_c0_g1~~TRINITY_DN8070_c0_g1_i9.p2  ORF type:complete len:314 (+),score=106.68 TRINITY_DN8070_c0_g1_i9:421-1362(+)